MFKKKPFVLQLFRNFVYNIWSVTISNNFMERNIFMENFKKEKIWMVADKKYRILDMADHRIEKIISRTRIQFGSLGPKPTL